MKKRTGRRIAIATVAVGILIIMGGIVSSWDMIIKHLRFWLIEWKAIDVADYQLLWPATSDPSIKLNNQVLLIGPNKPEYAQNDTADAGTCIQLGNEEWLDIFLRFEVQIANEEKVFFGARGHEQISGLYNFSWLSLNGLKFDDEEWKTTLVKINGTTMEITDSSGKWISNKNIKTPPGPFGIRVVGEKAWIKIRNLEVRVFNGAPSPI